MKMKLIIAALFLPLSQLTLASAGTKPFEIEGKLVLDCGKSLNIAQSIIVDKAQPGSWKPLIATAYLKGVDPTTGRIVGTQYLMEGSYEQDELGQYLAFVDVNKPQFQLLMEHPKEGQDSMEVVFLEITGTNTSNETNLSCTIK